VDLRELGERAAARGIRIGFEALAWGRHVNDHRDAWEIVSRADHPAVGLILDSFHTLARKLDPDSIRAIPADRIFLVQLADAPAIEMDLLQWSRHFRNMPGEGDLCHRCPTASRSPVSSSSSSPTRPTRRPRSSASCTAWASPVSVATCPRTSPSTARAASTW
jgi:hypothetical protein